MILLIGNHKNITMEPKVRFASLRAPELIEPLKKQDDNYRRYGNHGRRVDNGAAVPAGCTITDVDSLNAPELW